MKDLFGGAVVFFGFNALGFGYHAFYGDVLDREFMLSMFELCLAVVAVGSLGIYFTREKGRPRSATPGHRQQLP